MEDKEKTLRGYGYALAILDGALKAAGSRLREEEKDNFFLRPKEALAAIYRRAMVCGAITHDIEAEMTGALDLVDGERSDYGTKYRPLSASDMGTLMLACHHYDAERVSVKEAADALGVSVQRVYALLDEGKLEGIAVKGKRSVFASSLARRKAELG